MDQSCKLQQECPQIGQNPSLPETTSSPKIHDISFVKDKREDKTECGANKNEKTFKSWKGRNRCSICRLPKAGKRSKVLYSRYSCPCDVDLVIFEEEDLIFLEYCDEFSASEEYKSSACIEVDEISNNRPESLLTILNDVNKERIRVAGEISVADGNTDTSPKFYLLTLQNFNAEMLQAFETKKVTNPYCYGPISLNKNNNKMEETALFIETTGSKQKVQRVLTHASTSHESTFNGPGNRLPDESSAHTELLRGCSSTEMLDAARAATDEKSVNTGHDEKQSNERILHKTSDSQSYTYFKARPKIRKSCTQLLCRSATGSFTGGFQITVSRGHRGKRNKIIAKRPFPETIESTSTGKVQLLHNLNSYSYQQHPYVCNYMRKNNHAVSKSYQNENNLLHENDKHVSFSSTTMYFSYSTNDMGILESQRSSPTNPDQNFPMSERNNSNDASFSNAGQQFSGKVIHVQGDGRCLFRSLVASQCPILQGTRRDDYGRPERADLAEKETERADDLRARVVRLMKENLHFYSELGKDVLNADQPIQLSYKRFLDRLQAMTISTTMPGDLELNAAAMVLESPILVLSSELRRITSYGLDRFPQAPVLAVRYTRVVEDVGHYDAVILDNHNFVDNSQNMDRDDLKDPFKNHIHQFSRLSLKDKERDENGGGGDEVVEPKTVDMPPRVNLQAKKEFFFHRDSLTTGDRINSAIDAFATGSTHESPVSKNKDGWKEEAPAFAKENSISTWKNKHDLLEAGSESFNLSGDVHEEDSRYILIKNQVENVVKCSRKKLQTSNIKTDSKKITSYLRPGLFNEEHDIKSWSNDNECTKRSNSNMQDSRKTNTNSECGTPAKKARLSKLTPKKLDTEIPPRHKFNSKKVLCSKKKSKVYAQKYANLKARKPRHQNVNENSKTQRTLKYSYNVFKGKSKRTVSDKSSTGNCDSNTGTRFIALKNRVGSNADSSRYELTRNRSPHKNNSFREKEKKVKSTRRPLGRKDGLHTQRRRGGRQEPKRASRPLNYSRWNFQPVSQKRETANFGGGVQIPKPQRFYGEFMFGKEVCFLCRNAVVCQGHGWLRCSMCHKAAHRECVNQSFPCWDQHGSDEEYFLCQDCVHLM